MYGAHEGDLGAAEALVGIYVLTAALFSRCDYFVWWSLGGCDFFLDAVAEYCTVACCRPILYVRTMPASQPVYHVMYM
jgi:hypothetical protein